MSFAYSSFKCIYVAFKTYLCIDNSQIYVKFPLSKPSIVVYPTTYLTSPSNFTCISTYENKILDFSWDLEIEWEN